MKKQNKTVQSGDSKQENGVDDNHSDWQTNRTLQNNRKSNTFLYSVWGEYA